MFVYDRNIDRLRELDIAFGGRADTCFATTLSIEERLPDVDLVIGAVLVHGAKAPHVITRAQLALMKHQAVLVDVSIDQGGCFETSHPTTHSESDLRGRRHHPLLRGQHARCGAHHLHVRAHQRDHALRVLHLARAGVHQAVAESPGLKLGVNVANGDVTYAPVAEAVGVRHVNVDVALAGVPA